MIDLIYRNVHASFVCSTTYVYAFPPWIIIPFYLNLGLFFLLLLLCWNYCLALLIDPRLDTSRNYMLAQVGEQHHTIHMGGGGQR